MNYPLISEYIEAIKSAEDNFDELSYLRPVLSIDGEPVMSVGGFSVVFKMKDERDGKYYAVKCFTKEQEGRSESYKLIADELEYVSSNYLTPIKYLEKELFVDTGQSEETDFPVLMMDWVDGKTLDTFIEENLDNQYALEMLAYQFCKMASWLITQSFAHGDLKPDNIIIKEDGQLVLVDYDGMYVPTMKGQNARENGSPGYRHPLRTTDDIFDEHIDDFSIASIALSLKAIALNPQLWTDLGGNGSLLFSETDFCDLGQSKVISIFQSLMADKEFCTLYGIFMIVWALNDISSISYKLFNLQKTKKENITKVVSMYLKARKYVENEEYEKAYRIFETLADNGQKKGIKVEWTENLCGSVLGDNGLGYMYAKGFYVERDFSKAVSYFRKAIEHGFSMAQFNLGIAYSKGEGVEKNTKEANRLNHLAAIQGLGAAIGLESWWTIEGVSSKEETALNLERMKEISVYKI